MQIYTDNKAATATPKYTGTGVAAGLVDGVDTTRALPMCWRVADAKLTVTQNPKQGTTVGSTSYPDRIWDDQGGTSNEYPCYLWMEDKANADFANADPTSYRQVKDERGIQHAEATFAPGVASPDIIYVGAKFTDAMGSRTYSTNQLIVEVYQD
ncbi:MAG: hypothetical protein ACYC5N_04010 [Endomicrobiales bacterium]